MLGKSEDGLVEDKDGRFQSWRLEFSLVWLLLSCKFFFECLFFVDVTAGGIVIGALSWQFILLIQNDALRCVVL